MPLVSGPAIILQVFSYSDTSKILRLLTRDHGLQSVIAKGALRSKSRFGGVLEPFTEGVATFHRREARDLHTLSGFELLRTRQTLGSDLMRFGGAALLAELVLRVGSEETDAALYDLVQSGLDAIQSAHQTETESVVLAETWSIVSHLGFTPALDQCIHCGRSIEGPEDVMFDYTAGGVRCLDCGTGLGGRLVPPAARAALRELVSGRTVRLERTAAHWRLLARYLSHHVLEGQTLRSLDFIAETLDSETE